MYRGLSQLLDLESVFVEPSCATVLMGPAALSALANTWAEGSGPLDGKGVPGRAKAEFLLQEGVHVLWMTGGGLVPAAERDQYNEVREHRKPTHVLSGALYWMRSDGWCRVYTAMARPALQLAYPCGALTAVAAVAQIGLKLLVPDTDLKQLLKQMNVDK
jgi:hypothetical protein